MKWILRYILHTVDFGSVFEHDDGQGVSGFVILALLVI